MRVKPNSQISDRRRGVWPDRRLKRRGPRTEPCGTPQETGSSLDLHLPRETYSVLPEGGLESGGPAVEWRRYRRRD